MVERTRCYKMATALWQKLKLTRKDIGVTTILLGSDFCVELPDLIQEVHAHCKWCAVFDVLTKWEGDDA